jgi:hypothetical protein
MATQNEIIDLFPVPKPLQTTDFLVPKPLPGVTPASTAALREILKDNHDRFHCFFNDFGFHKYAFVLYKRIHIR